MILVCIVIRLWMGFLVNCSMLLIIICLWWLKIIWLLFFLNRLVIFLLILLVFRCWLLSRCSIVWVVCVCSGWWFCRFFLWCLWVIWLNISMRIEKLMVVYR